ncbi:ABC transporter ATP-binding protein [Paenibacillus contaminans]|nr:ABC transporter ATP-binding protein [Paenibacillus contaminans]
MGWFARKKQSLQDKGEEPIQQRPQDKPDIPEQHEIMLPEESDAGNGAPNAVVSRDKAQRAKELAALNEPLLIVKDVQRSFQVGGQKLHVLKGISMELYPKQLVMLRGRSGSGKTTLMNLIGGLDQPNSGEIVFKGHPFHTWNDEQRTVVRRSEIGFIFQSYALMPLLSAYENVELSLRMAQTPRAEWKARVQHCLELVGLGKRMHHRPFELSGGEQQRVAIAKSIAHRPSLLLADEPTAELDSQMGAQVMNVFQNIIEEEKVTICMTTHDPTILEVADHVFEMVDGKFKQY